MDLSKAFDSLNNGLLLTKLEACGLDNPMSFMRCYLTDGLQRCKINNSFGEWAKIPAGVSQGSILNPLLLNIFINDIFLLLLKCYLAIYADDSTISAIIFSLRHEFTILSK